MEKPRTQDDVRRENFNQTARNARALINLALNEIDEALSAPPPDVEHLARMDELHQIESSLYQRVWQGRMTYAEAEEYIQAHIGWIEGTVLNRPTLLE